MTSLNASQLTSSTVADARLSANVALRDANQTFTGVNTSNNAGNSFDGTFSGNGAGVTNLNLALNSRGAISGPGSFVLSSSPGVGFEPVCVTAADVNADGKVDLISANFSGNFSAGTLTVLFNVQLPQLTIVRTGANVILSWPTNVAGFDSTGYTLQSTTNLALPNSWFPVAQSPATNVGQVSVTLPGNVGSKFFQLKSQ